MTKGHKIPARRLQETIQYHLGLLQNTTVTALCPLQDPLRLQAHKISHLMSATTIRFEQSASLYSNLHLQIMQQMMAMKIE